MSKLKICPFCKRIVGYNSYFHSYYCPSCGWMENRKNLSAKIPSPVGKVLRILNSNGYEAYVVGGCVRDLLMGRNPHDWDVCTSAIPEDVTKLFPKVIPTGIKHGTVTVLMNEMQIEVTTFRTDGDYKDHRHPGKVRFVSSLQEDLARRDFTINAMALREDGAIVDPFHGEKDIALKRICCVGKPDQRFQEDALRILRAMRFASVLGFIIESDTYQAMLRNRNLLQYISAERIQAELRKMIVGERAGEILTACKQILAQFIPEFSHCFDFEQHSVWHCYDVFQHITKAVAVSSPDEIVRLALLFHDIGKPACFQLDEDGCGHFHGHGEISAQMADEIMTRLRFDNDTRERVVKLIRYHDVRLETTLKTVRRWVAKIGREDFGRFLEVRRGDILAQADHERQVRLAKLERLNILYHEVLQEKPLMSVKDLSVNGYDLMVLGYPEGPEIGQVLNELLEKVLDGSCENTKEGLIQELKTRP